MGYCIIGGGIASLEVILHNRRWYCIIGLILHHRRCYCIIPYQLSTAMLLRHFIFIYFIVVAYRPSSRYCKLIPNPLESLSLLRGEILLILSTQVLDGSRVHPETYEWARKMAVDALEYDDTAEDANPAGRC